jgi:hypothetical protein
MTQNQMGAEMPANKRGTVVMRECNTAYVRWENTMGYLIRLATG